MYTRAIEINDQNAIYFSNSKFSRSFAAPIEQANIEASYLNEKSQFCRSERSLALGAI